MSRSVYDVLSERGFVQQVTDEVAVRALFEAGPVTAYLGLDATADSLHVGNLFVLMSLIHLERHGHRPIVLLGSGTTMVGDPSGKTEMRKMLSREQILANVERFKAQIGRLLDIAGDRTRVVDNADWLLSLKYIDFLRDIGRHFSVNRMLSAEAYKQRLERGLSFIEFNYQLLQAYDFLQLNQRYDCVLQMGGDDQWGNIVAGVDLCRRVSQRQVQGLTFPLLLSATGHKMGKSEAGAVWIDAERLAPYDFYQYWINTHDDDVGRMLGYFTFLPMAEVKAASHLLGVELNAAKSVLAYEVTRLVHGEAAAREAHSAAQAAFGQRAISADILPSSTLPRGGRADAAQIPTTTVSVVDGIPLTQLLADVGLASSKNEARRLIRQKAIKINDAKQVDEHYVVTRSDFQDGRIMLRAGKKKVHQVLLR